MQQQQGASSNTGAVAAAWIVVMLPLLWGVYNTILNVAKLFH
jgi:hypothetical protein